jgi:hypothetical protein
MREFTRAYKRHRLAAMERGEGFMPFKVAPRQGCGAR